MLRSKAADSSTVNEEQRNEVSVVVRHPPAHERDRTHPDNGSMKALVSMPLGSSRVRKLLEILVILVSFMLSFMQDGVVNLLILMTSLTGSR